MIGGVERRAARLEVYETMLYQILRDYNSLGDWRSLKSSEIEWLYDGLRRELMERTKPNG